MRCYCCSFCFFVVVGDRTNALIECEDEAADDGGAVVECEAFPCFPRKRRRALGGDLNLVMRVDFGGFLFLLRVVAANVLTIA